MKTGTRNTRKKRNRSTRRGAWYWIAIGAFVGHTAAASPAYAAAPPISAASWVQVQDSAVLTFDIPPGLLETVLEAFERTTGMRTTLSQNAIGGIESPGVRGSLTAQQALTRLLSNTGVNFRFTAQETVSLELAGLSESIDVSASIPVVGPSSVKFTEPLRDIPQTITIIPASVIKEQGATTLREVLRNVSGISIQAGEGGVPAGDNLSVRGFSARTDLFVDGVRDFGSYARDPFNVEQIEVAKGPSSSFVGRGSTGGSINLSSKIPSLTAARTATLGGGSSSYKRATVDVNQPIGAIKGAAFRFNGMFTNGGAPGRDVVENRRWGLAPSLAFGLDSMTKVIFSYSHLDQDNLPDYGIPWVPNTNIPLAAYADEAPPVSFNNFYGLTTRDYEKTFTRIGTGELRHDFNDSVGIRSVLRYGRTKRDSVIAAPRFASTAETILNRQLQSRDQTDTIAASQTNLVVNTVTGDLEHAVVAGIEFARETSRNFARTGPAAPQADLYNPDANQLYSGPITRTGAVTRSVADTAAAYAGDTVKFNDKWQVTGSLRFDQFQLDYRSTATDGLVSPFESTDTMLSGRAGLVYKPVANGSLYVGYGTSLNPSAEGLSLTAATADLKPEKSRSYEAGTKWDFLSNRLSMNAAYFRTEKTNARTPGVNPGDPPTVLNGEQYVDGVEFGVQGFVSSTWETFTSYTFMRSRIVTSNNAAEVGREFGNTPRHSFNVWTNYQFPWRFDLGGGVNYVGDRYNGNTNTARLAPGYWLADLTAAYHVSERLTLRLNANNLTNERYIDRVGGGHFVPGAGRSAMLTLDVGL
jgi:catecholate siderophore receptor